MLDNRMTIRLPAKQHQFVFDAFCMPALTIDPDEIVVVETLDCFCGRLTPDSPLLVDDDDVLKHIGGHYNPVNRPIFVRGAEPGDVLAVEILDIALGARQGFAVTHVARDWACRFGGEAFADSVAPSTIFAEVEGRRVRLPVNGRIVDCEARPMIGTIGTAPPPGAAASSLIYGPGHGGNLDCPGIRPGATVLLPVNVPGALLSLGDVHALMGDGEVTGTALETSADVTVRIGLRKGGTPLATPRLTDAATIGSIGCSSRTSLQENIRCAVLDLSSEIVERGGLSAGDALQMINLFGRIVVNQAVGANEGGWASVLIKIERTSL